MQNIEGLQSEELISLFKTARKPCGARLIERAGMPVSVSGAHSGDVWAGLEANCLFASVRHIDVANKLIQEVAGLHPAA